jgi:hypothetical protein
MKFHRFILLTALLTSPAFAQTHINATYLEVQPQNNAGEGGEMVLHGSGGIDSIYLDNFHGSLRLLPLAPGKQFQILGGTIFVNGTGAANYLEGSVGIGNPAPRQKLEVGSGSNPAINIHDFSTAELTLGINEQSNYAQFNTNSNGFRFVTGQDGVTFPGVGNEVLRITSAGNVGIGTSTPTAKLDIAGNTRVGGDLILGGNNGGGNKLLLASTSDCHFIRSSGWWTEFVSHPNEGWKFISNGGADNYKECFRIAAGTGNVGIGTTNPTHKLAVNGTIKAKEVIVETAGWSDYVFADGYKLAPLSEVEAHIKANKHLPGIPSAAQVAETGVNLGDVQAALLAKVEELTLHLIAQQKQMESQSRTLESLQKENLRLEQRLQHIESR